MCVLNIKGMEGRSLLFFIISEILYMPYIFYCTGIIGSSITSPDFFIVVTV